MSPFGSVADVGVAAAAGRTWPGASLRQVSSALIDGPAAYPSAAAAGPLLERGPARRRRVPNGMDNAPGVGRGRLLWQTRSALAGVTGPVALDVLLEKAPRSEVMIGRIVERSAVPPNPPRRSSPPMMLVSAVLRARSTRRRKAGGTEGSEFLIDAFYRLSAVGRGRGASIWNIDPRIIESWWAVTFCAICFSVDQLLEQRLERPPPSTCRTTSASASPAW